MHSIDIEHGEYKTVNSKLSIASCATASTTAKTVEMTDQTAGRYLLEIDRSNDQSSDQSISAVDRFYNSAQCTLNARMSFF